MKGCAGNSVSHTPLRYRNCYCFIGANEGLQNPRSQRVVEPGFDSNLQLGSKARTTVTFRPLLKMQMFLVAPGADRGLLNADCFLGHLQ